MLLDVRVKLRTREPFSSDTFTLVTVGLFWRTVLYVEHLSENIKVDVHSFGRPAEAHLFLKKAIREVRGFVCNIVFAHVPYHVDLKRVRFGLLERFENHIVDFPLSNTCSVVLPGGNSLMYTESYPSTEDSVLCER